MSCVNIYHYHLLLLLIITVSQIGYVNCIYSCIFKAWKDTTYSGTYYQMVYPAQEGSQIWSEESSSLPKKSISSIQYFCAPGWDCVFGMYGWNNAATGNGVLTRSCTSGGSDTISDLRTVGFNDHIKSVKITASRTPTPKPTKQPTDQPTDKPTKNPTDEPTDKPTDKPTTIPTQSPTAKPTAKPTPPGLEMTDILWTPDFVNNDDQTSSVSIVGTSYVSVDDDKWYVNLASIDEISQVSSAIKGTLYSNKDECETFQSISYTFNDDNAITREKDRFIILSDGNKYISLIFDLDGAVLLNNQDKGGLGVYPSCGSNNLGQLGTVDADDYLFGDYRNNINNEYDFNNFFWDVRDLLADGDSNEFDLISGNERIGNHNSYTITLLNDIYNNKLTITFKAGVEGTDDYKEYSCQYLSAFTAKSDISMYWMIDANEITELHSILVDYTCDASISQTFNDDKIAIANMYNGHGAHARGRIMDDIDRKNNNEDEYVNIIIVCIGLLLSMIIASVIGYNYYYGNKYKHKYQAIIDNNVSVNGNYQSVTAHAV